MPHFGGTMAVKPDATKMALCPHEEGQMWTATLEKPWMDSLSTSIFYRMYLCIYIYNYIYIYIHMYECILRTFTSLVFTARIYDAPNLCTLLAAGA